MRIILAVSSFVGACWLMSYAHDIQNMILWAVSAMYIVLFMMAQLWPVKKPRGGNHEANIVEQTERTINFKETQLK